MEDLGEHNGILKAIHEAVLAAQRDVGKLDGRLEGMESHLHGMDAGITGMRAEMVNVLQRMTGIEGRVGGCEDKVASLKHTCESRKQKCSVEFKSMVGTLRSDLGKIEDTGVHNLVEMAGRRAQWKLLKVLGIVLMSLLGAVGTALGAWAHIERMAETRRLAKPSGVIRTHGVVVVQSSDGGAGRQKR